MVCRQDVFETKGKRKAVFSKVIAEFSGSSGPTSVHEESDESLMRNGSIPTTLEIEDVLHVRVVGIHHVLHDVEALKVVGWRNHPCRIVVCGCVVDGLRETGRTKWSARMY